MSVGIFNKSDLSVTKVASNLFGDDDYNDTKAQVATNKTNISLTQDAISDAWVNGTSYTVGSLVIHNNILWKCTTATSSEEPSSSASCWSQTSVDSEIGLLNNKYYVETKSFSNLSWSAGIQGQSLGTLTKTGYSPIGVFPASLARASTTLFTFQISSVGALYMTTNSTYAESSATEVLNVIWEKTS